MHIKFRFAKATLLGAALLAATLPVFAQSTTAPAPSAPASAQDIQDLKQLIQQQGDITANATQEQILALNTQSQEASNQATMQTNAGNAAGSAATGALVGGAFKAVAGIASIALA